MKSKRYESSEIYEKENQNPFAALFEYVSRSSDFAHAGFAPFSKKALYVLYNLAYVDSSVSVQSYIYGGLVRLDCKSDETSFSVEYDCGRYNFFRDKGELTAQILHFHDVFMMTP